MKVLLINRAVLIALSAYFHSNNVLADAVYKSVDKEGNITYSSSPTDNHQQADKVDILPPPSEEAANAAQERHQQNLRAEKTFEENRQNRSQKIAEDNRIKREKMKLPETSNKPEEEIEEGPYYGIPGHGIMVLPTGPRIRR